MGEPHRLGTKQGKGHPRWKKVIAGSIAIGGALLGVKADQEIKKQQREQGEIDVATLSAIGSQFKPMGQGTEVIGVGSEGNIYGGAGVQAGAGVVLGRNAPADHILPAPLDPSRLEPFKQRVGGVAGQAAVGAVAGIVAGQHGAGEGLRQVAGAVAGAAQKPRDPQREAIEEAGRGALGGASVVVGAEGMEASNRELLGQLKGKGKQKVKGLFKFGG